MVQLLDLPRSGNETSSLNDSGLCNAAVCPMFAWRQKTAAALSFVPWETRLDLNHPLGSNSLLCPPKGATDGRRRRVAGLQGPRSEEGEEDQDVEDELFNDPFSALVKNCNVLHIVGPACIFLKQGFSQTVVRSSTAGSVTPHHHLTSPHWLCWSVPTHVSWLAPFLFHHTSGTINPSVRAGQTIKRAGSTHKERLHGLFHGNYWRTGWSSNTERESLTEFQKGQRRSLAPLVPVWRHRSLSKNDLCFVAVLLLVC